ncbi:RNA polymerase sigma factor [bacterium]|nr:RNA polymerase sigma factor [bacterium]
MNYITASDEDLMLAYKNGEEAAFNYLLERHKKGVYNFLYRFLGQNENVEEAFQDVFFRVIRSSQAYEPQAKFTTFLYTIARNYCIDMSRKKKTRPVSALEDKKGAEDEESRWEEKVEGSNFTPEQEVLAQNLHQKLEWILSQINPDQREVFLLREKQGLPFEEIATIVGASVNTVKSRMRYAVASLQDFFKKLGITDL